MRIVVELSGGADSTLAYLIARERWPKARFYPLFVDYGQIYAKEEKERARRVLRGKTALKEIVIKGVSLLKRKVEVPYRNLIIGAIALNYADKLGAKIIINGSKSLTQEGQYDFRDSTLPFYMFLQAIADYANEKRRRIQILPILAEGRNKKMTKQEVYQELERRGIGLKDVWSCWFPQKGKECGKCRNCKEKNDYLLRRRRSR